MKNNKLGQQGAFPQKNIEISEEHKGMSKRFYAACAAMQGIIASKTLVIWNTKDQEACARIAYQFADELLRQEDE